MIVERDNDGVRLSYFLFCVVKIKQKTETKQKRERRSIVQITPISLSVANLNIQHNLFCDKY
jgi:hypothetical protein